jgi:small basic protein (TIGR04137 family)
MEKGRILHGPGSRVKGETGFGKVLVMGGGELYTSNPLTTRHLLLSAMSQHKSLQGASGIIRKRNVLKRFERIEVLKKRGQWKAGDRIQGLRKTKPDV